MTNNGFLDGFAFDGMRKHASQTISTRSTFWIWAGTCARIRSSPARRTTSLAFRSASASTFLSRRTERQRPKAEIFYARVDEFWRKEEKYRYLDANEQYLAISSGSRLTPDKRNTWLTKGLHAEFETFVPLGSREAKAAKGEADDVIFQVVQPWCQHKPRCVGLQLQSQRAQKGIWGKDDRYLQRAGVQVGTAGLIEANVDDFVLMMTKKISWSHTGLNRSSRRQEYSRICRRKCKTFALSPICRIESLL